MKDTNGLEILKENIASTLKELRKESGLSQKKLARLVGVDQSIISRFESGKLNEYPLSLIWKIADIFNFDVEMEFVPKD